MYKLLLLALLFNPFTINAHSLTTGTPFENGLSHFREGDFESAYAEWLEGAEQGDAGAQFGLGLMYYSGQGIKQDYSSAFEWMKKSAMNGNYNAQNNLGVMYLQGHGVDESLVHAFAWYSVAAAQGQRDAKKNVEILSDQLSEEQRAQAGTLIVQFKEAFVVW